MPECHFLQGRCGNRTALAEEFVVHKHSFSTWALLLLVRRWATSLSDLEGRRRAHCLFGALVRLAPQTFDFEVQCAQFERPDSHEFVVAHVRSGVVQPDMQLQQSAHIDRQGCCGWPFAQAQLADLALAGSIACGQIVADTLRGLAKALEPVLVSKHASSTDVLAKLLRQDSYFIDPHIKEQMASVGRNSFRASKFCKAMQLRVAGNAYRQQLLERTKYWLALRELLSSGCTFATSVDATRFSGKDWQCGPICSVDAQKFGWMAPIVPLRMMLCVPSASRY